MAEQRIEFEWQIKAKELIDIAGEDGVGAGEQHCEHGQHRQRQKQATTNRAEIASAPRLARQIARDTHRQHWWQAKRVGNTPHQPGDQRGGRVPKHFRVVVQHNAQCQQAKQRQGIQGSEGGRSAPGQAGGKE